MRICGARSDIWDTSFALQALSEGPPLPLAHAIAHDAAAWLPRAQLHGDIPHGAEHYREPADGGWGFADEHHPWPVSDCTAEALEALLALRQAPVRRARSPARAPARRGPLHPPPPERGRRLRILRAAPRQHDPPPVQPRRDLRQLHARVLVQRVHRELRARPRGTRASSSAVRSATPSALRSTLRSTAASPSCSRPRPRTAPGPAFGASTTPTAPSSSSPPCSPPASRPTTPRSSAPRSGCSPPSAPTAAGARASRACCTTARSPCPRANPAT
jgi:hypothetical protein